MKETLFILMAVFLISVSACAQDEPPVAEQNTEKVVIMKQDGKRHLFNMEIADTPERQKYGLMYRKNLPEDNGMLFIFSKERERGFWMQNTFIPLDMLFVKADGVIHHIHQNARPHDLTSIPSNGPVLGVLEINGGLSEKLNFQPGDIVHHAVFGNVLAE